jgi:hypothetical protein
VALLCLVFLDKGAIAMKVNLIAILGVLFCLIGFKAAAESTEDILALAQKGVGDEILIATVERSDAAFTLRAADILKLKDAKVSDKVIQAMLKHKPGVTLEAAGRPRPEAPVADKPVAAPQPNPVTGPVTGTLNIENVDDKAWSYSVEPETRTIWISGATDGKGNLTAHGGISVRMAAGAYKVRYNGKDSGPALTVRSGEKSLLMLSRVNNDQTDALYGIVFENGARKGSALLMQLRQSPAPRDTQNGGTREAATASVERVVERERVVEVPQTTVVYRDTYVPPTTVIYSGYPRYYTTYPYYYCGPSYHRPSSFFSFNFGYSSGHHHRR